MKIRDAAFVLAFVTSSHAYAELVVLNFSGYVDHASGDYQTMLGQQLNSSIHLGDSFSGSIRFDLAESSYHESSEWNDTWWWTASNNRMSLNIGNYTFSPSTSDQMPMVAQVLDANYSLGQAITGVRNDEVVVYNEFGPVHSLINRTTGLPVDPNLSYLGSMQWRFLPAFPYTEAISRASISELVNADLSKWEQSYVSVTLGWNDPSLTGNNYTGFSFSGLVTIGEIAAPVPEPETYAMILAGLGLLGVITRGRKQKLNA